MRFSTNGDTCVKMSTRTCDNV